MTRTPGSALPSAAQRAELDARGFTFTDALFDEGDLAPVRAECLRLFRESLAAPGDAARLRLQGVRPFLPALHERSALLAEFARHEVFQEIAGALVGPDVDQTWNQACVKMPDEEGLTAFPFHQDGRFAQTDGRDTGLSIFLALGSLTEENGTLWFAAGAHHAALPHVRDARLEWWSCDVSPFEVVPAVLSPGRAAVYRLMCPHGSPPNRSAVPREAYLVTFNVPGTRLLETGEPFGDRRPFLRGSRLV